MARDRGNSTTYSMSRVSLLFEYSSFSSHLEPFPDLGESSVSQAHGPLPRRTPIRVGSAPRERAGQPAVRHCVHVEIRCSWIEALFSLLPSAFMRFESLLRHPEQKQLPPIFASPPKYTAAGWREAAGGGGSLFPTSMI